MMFKSAQAALERYVEYKLEECESTPSFFSAVDKFRVVKSQKWMCVNCHNITDVHTGECEICYSDLVSYRCDFSNATKTEESAPDNLDYINFIIDFEKILKKFNYDEIQMLLYVGYGGYGCVIDFLLDKHHVKNTCENVSYSADKINEVGLKLTKMLIEADYIKGKDNADDDSYRG